MGTRSASAASGPGASRSVFEVRRGAARSGLLAMLLMVVPLAVGAQLPLMPAAANGPSIVTLVECDSTVRGIAICFEPTTRIGGAVVAGNSVLEYEYGNLPTIRISTTNPGEVPAAGLRAGLDIVYPRVSNATYVGDELAISSFALVQADDFDFIKTFVDVSGADVPSSDSAAVAIRYDFDFTFAAVSIRTACGFADRSQFPFTAKPACESANGGDDGSTVDLVSNTIIFDPSNPDFAPAYADGGFTNFHSQEGLTIIEDGTTPGRPAGVFWQIVGPKFAENGDPNRGTAQLFLAAAHREWVFGADFVVSGTSGLAVDRRDRVDGDSTVVIESVLDIVAVTERRGGLLITIDPYPFPAPLISVIASGEGSSSTTASGSEGGSAVVVACEGSMAVGSEVSCAVTGGDPGIDILWRAAYNPPFAGEGVRLDASGSGAFSFTVPLAALGEVLTVELVDWTAPQSLGVVGGPLPSSVPTGEGPVPVWTLGLLALAGGLVLRRRSGSGWPALRVS